MRKIICLNENLLNNFIQAFLPRKIYPICGAPLFQSCTAQLCSVVKCRNSAKITVLIIFRRVALIFKFNCRLLATEKTIHQIMSTMYNNVL